MSGSAHGGNRMVAALLLILIIVFLANLVMTFWVLRQNSAPTSSSPMASYCQAIPTKLILEDPQCADKLLRAMNVANVRVLPRSAVTSGSHGQTGQSALNST